MDSTKQTTKSDVDRQFEEDLERARALSLESLALEKFKQCKQQKELEKQNEVEKHRSNATSVQDAFKRKLSVPHNFSVNVPERLELKSRPRPGSFNSGASRNPQILAPPPIARRVSVSATDGPKDLISFSSPDSDKSNLYPDLDQLCGTLAGQGQRDESISNERQIALVSPISSLSRSNCSVSNFGSQRQLSMENATISIPTLSHSQSDSVATRGAQFPGFAHINYFSTSPSVSNLSSFSNLPYVASPLSTSAPFLGSSSSQPFNHSPSVDALKTSSSMTSFGGGGMAVIPALPGNPSIPVRSYEARYTLPTNGSTDSGLNSTDLSVFSQASFPSKSQTVESPVVGGLEVLRVVEKKDNSNLIDLSLFDVQKDNFSSHSSKKGMTVRTSVLEAFDPLLVSTEPNAVSCAPIQEHVDEGDDAASQCSGSLYDPYDPFDFMYAISEGSQADPVYAAVVKKKEPLDAASTSPPPLPPRNYVSKTAEEKKKNRHKSFLHDEISESTCNTSYTSSDLRAFHQMVVALRAEHQHDDLYTNTGLVTSSTIESHYSEGTSIKLIVHSVKESGTQTVTFTCDVDSTVEHVILHVMCELEGDVPGEASDYVLRVWGLAEYLTPGTSLSDYEYVHNCIKLEEDVTLAIMHMDQVLRPLARTLQDDNRDKTLTLENLLPNEPVTPISFESLKILLETLEGEMGRLQRSSEQSTSGSSLQPIGVVQAVKHVCAILGNVETSEITEAVEALMHNCQRHTQNYSPSPPQPEKDNPYRTEIGGDDGYYSVVTLRKKSNNGPEGIADRQFSEVVGSHCDKIRSAVHHLIETYCQAFRVNIQLDSLSTNTAGTRCLASINYCVLVRIDGLHRLQPSWDYDEYLIAGQVYHGTRPVGHTVLSQPMGVQKSYYERVLFDSWLNFDSLSINMLPREARLVLVLYGKSITKSADSDHDAHEGSHQMSEVELGWSSLQFFNFDGVLTQGNFLLSLWPAGADKRLGPAPVPGSHPHNDIHPVLGIELPDYGGTVMFPSKDNGEKKVVAPTYDFDSLDQNTQQQLLDIIDQDTFTRPIPENREVLWEKRHYLHHKPEALAKVILAAHDWDHTSAAQMHALLHSWTPMEPVQALQLLLPCYPDGEVRHIAVSWIQGIGRDEIIDYLPQLVQALKHETYDASPLAAFLLRRALCSPRVAHHLYWLLTQSLPGQCPQNSSEPAGTDDRSVCEARYHRRLQLMLRALLSISGEALRQRFFSQQMLLKGLLDVAQSVKSTKDSLRLQALSRDLEYVHKSLAESSPTCLPLSPALEVSGIQVRTSSYFLSNTLPLKINFIGSNSGIIPAIFKVGDDLQQDMLTIQMIRVMDKFWLKEGLDLKMVTFTCVPTGHKRGMIEMVQQAETLRKIQGEFGLTGSFKDRPIAEWLAKHNPSALEYERAVRNFTASCAGYSVATYILGICDRHNDNIMLKTSGHLFHIDFGKFLGDAQMFGNFKRDRTPFVLTSDMAYVINGGVKPSAKFHHFVDLCCQAFNIVRKHGNLILNMFGLMASSGISGVTMDAVKYVQHALLPELTNPEAAAYFARMIQSSLNSWFTQFNFFLHNLAQLRFTGDHNDGELLSFIPKTYTMQQEGRIKSTPTVFGCQKRYDPEKYYVYILRVERENQPDPTYLFRSYKEFCELQQKLCIHFPLAKCHSLTSGLHMGRSNIKQVAEKRRLDIEKFLVSLFRMAAEISHSDLVYTFFHPLLRDQEEASMASIHAAKFKERKASRPQGLETHRLKGQLKLSLQYQRETLMVMVHHARELPFLAGSQEPSAYVKVYLLPDPSKATKRKTKVVRRNCHPTFMEMIEYRMPFDVVCHRTLQATVWNHDTLQENEFLGGVSLPLQSCDLSKETSEWYSLGNVCR